MLNGIIFTIGCIMAVVSRYFYFIADDEDNIIGAIILDMVGTLGIIMSLLHCYENL